MRLEVISDSKGAVIYVLNSPEIYIGSIETNDIVIAAKEISKKHIKLIITEDKKCFAIDQGSTNGSFIDDERMIPGRREEFPMFSSIRLGDQVLLTLLDKVKGDVPELPLREHFIEEKKVVIAEEDKTRVISLKSLQKAKTEKVRKKRLKSLEAKIKKKKIVRKDKATLNRAILTAILVIAGAFMAMKVWDVAKARRARRTIIGQIKETRLIIDDQIELMDENFADVRIPSALLVPIGDIAKHAEDVNCSLPEELFFCKRMSRGSRKRNGAINLNGQIVIYIEQKEWFDRAQALFAFHSQLIQKEKAETELTPVKTYKEVDDSLDEDEVKKETKLKEDNELASQEMLHRIAFLSYLKTYLGGPLPPDLQVYNLYFVFYMHVGTEIEISNVMALRASAVAQLNRRYTEDFFKSKKYNPFKIITKLDRFYRIY